MPMVMEGADSCIAGQAINCDGWIGRLETGSDAAVATGKSECDCRPSWRRSIPETDDGQSAAGLIHPGLLTGRR